MLDSMEDIERGKGQKIKFTTPVAVSPGQRKGGVCVQIPGTSFSGPALVSLLIFIGPLGRSKTVCKHSFES